MNQYIPRINKITQIITLAAITGLAVMLGNNVQGQTTDDLDQTQFPTITSQPVDQVVPVGSSVVLSVQANNADGYQWLRNGVLLDGRTNSVLIIQNAGTNDVGLYSCEVFNGSEMVPTRAANVSVYTASSSGVATGASAVAAKSSAVMAKSTGVAPCLPGGGPIIVFGTPILSGGKQGTCPGPYTACVGYTKTISQGWGWAPITGATVLTAADGSGRTDTKIQYCGIYGDNGCAQTTVTIPYPPISPVYRFGIYFTNNVPTNAYPIVLTGFNQ